MPHLRPEFGPTLPQLLSPRLKTTPQRLRLIIVVVVTVLVAVQLGRIALARHGKGLPNELVVRGALPFNLAYRDGLRNVKPPPAGTALELRTADTTAPQTMTVAVAPFVPGAGDVSAALSLRVPQELAALQRQFPDGFRPRGDSRTRINLLPAQVVLFQARVAGKTVYGKRFLIVPDVPRPTEVATLTLLSTRSPAIPTVSDVGNVGLLKAPLRSFRFGTERP